MAQPGAEENPPKETENMVYCMTEIMPGRRKLTLLEPCVDGVSVNNTITIEKNDCALETYAMRLANFGDPIPYIDWKVCVDHIYHHTGGSRSCGGNYVNTHSYAPCQDMKFITVDTPVAGSVFGSRVVFRHRFEPEHVLLFQGCDILCVRSDKRE